LLGRKHVSGGRTSLKSEALADDQVLSDSRRSSVIERLRCLLPTWHWPADPRRKTSTGALTQISEGASTRWRSEGSEEETDRIEA
jgi:hypothetical protein